MAQASSSSTAVTARMTPSEQADVDEAILATAGAPEEPPMLYSDAEMSPVYQRTVEEELRQVERLWAQASSHSQAAVVAKASQQEPSAAPAVVAKASQEEPDPSLADVLPDDVLTRMSPYLSVKDKLRFGATCGRLQSLVLDRSFWKHQPIEMRVVLVGGGAPPNCMHVTSLGDTITYCHKIVQHATDKDYRRQLKKIMWLTAVSDQITLEIDIHVMWRGFGFGGLITGHLKHLIEHGELPLTGASVRVRNKRDPYPVPTTIALLTLLNSLNLSEFALTCHGIHRRMPKLDGLTSLQITGYGPLRRPGYVWDIADYLSPNIRELRLIPALYVHELQAIFTRCPLLTRIDVELWDRLDLEMIDLLDLSNLIEVRMELHYGLPSVEPPVQPDMNNEYMFAVVLRLTEKLRNATTIKIHHMYDPFTKTELPLSELFRVYMESRSHQCMQTHCRLEVIHERGNDIVHFLAGPPNEQGLLECTNKAVIEELVGLDFLGVVDKMNLVVDRVKMSTERNRYDEVLVTIKLNSLVQSGFSCDFCIFAD